MGERQPGLLGDHLAAGEGGEVAEVVDAPVPEAGRADRDGLAACWCWLLETSIPSAEPSTFSARIDQRARGLHDRVERGQEVLRVRDRLGRHEDVGVVEDRLHPRRGR